MNWLLYVLAGWAVAGDLILIGKVGKPRDPVTGREAAITTVVIAVLVVALVVAAVRLT